MSSGFCVTASGLSSVRGREDVSRATSDLPASGLVRCHHKLMPRGGLKIQLGTLLGVISYNIWLICVWGLRWRSRTRYSMCVRARTSSACVAGSATGSSRNCQVPRANGLSLASSDSRISQPRQFADLCERFLAPLATQGDYPSLTLLCLYAVQAAQTQSATLLYGGLAGPIHPP